MKLTAVVVMMALFSACHAAAFLGAGCPDGHRPGETWNPPGCQECTCGDTTYECYGCGVMSFEFDKSQCYLEKNEAASYPKCCEENIFCKGDPGFDATKLRYPADRTTKTTPSRKTKTTRAIATKRRPT